MLSKLGAGGIPLELDSLHYERLRSKIRYSYEGGPPRQDDASATVIFRFRWISENIRLYGVMLCVEKSDEGSNDELHRKHKLHRNFLIGDCVEDNCGIGLFYVDVTPSTSAVVLNRRAAEFHIVHSKMNNMVAERGTRQSPRGDSSTSEEKLKRRKQHFDELDKIFDNNLSKEFVEGDYTKRDASFKLALLLYDPWSRNTLYQESPVINPKGFGINLTSLRFEWLNEATGEVHLLAKLTLNSGKIELSNNMTLENKYGEASVTYSSSGNLIYQSISKGRKTVSARFSDAKAICNFRDVLHNRLRSSIRFEVDILKPERQKLCSPTYIVTLINQDELEFRNETESCPDNRIICLNENNFLTREKLQQAIKGATVSTADVEPSELRSPPELMNIAEAEVEADQIDEGNLNNGFCDLPCDDFVADTAFAQMNIEKVPMEILDYDMDDSFELCMNSANETVADDFHRILTTADAQVELLQGEFNLQFTYEDMVALVKDLECIKMGYQV